MAHRTVQKLDTKRNPALGNERGRIQPEFGGTYPGVICAFDPDKEVYSVRLDHTGQTVPGCVYAAGFFSALIGVKAHFRPMMGTRVLLAYGNPAYIVGTAPSDPPDKSGGKGRKLVASDVKLDKRSKNLEKDSANNGATAGQDLFPGELEIGTQTGVAVQFLTFLLKLQAGERAKIECHLVDDMVRIVSETFRHYSSFGDFEISNTGGGPTVIWHGSSKTHEVWGQVNPKDPKVKKVDKRKVAKEDVAETGRHRFSQFIGYLGDFMHLMLADPEETIGQLAQQRVGKFDCHINNDGSLLVRSVAEIAFERVDIIPMPIQRRALDDPEGNTREEIEAAVRDQGLNLDRLLARWDYGKNNSRMHLLPFQLREYARYLAQFHGFARMLSQDKDWEFESEATARNRQKPSWNNGESDVAAANKGKLDYYQVYSTIRILRDGSQLHLDGYGNALVMGKAGVQVSSYLDILLEAGRDVRIVGKNVFIMARNNVEIVAAVGRLILKARTFLQALCEWGGIHIKSDAPSKNDPQFGSRKKTKADQPAPDEDPEPVFLEDHAVLIEASYGGTVLSAGRQAVVRSTGVGLADAEKDDTDNTFGSVLLQSEKQDVLLHGARNVLQHARGSDAENTGIVGLKGKAVALHGREKGVQLKGPLVDLNQGLTVRGKTVHAQTIVAQKVAAIRGLLGPDVGPQKPKGQVGAHFGHVGSSEGEELELAESDEVEAVVFVKERPFDVVRLFAGRAPGWDFLPKLEYQPDAKQKPDDRLPWRSLTQERIVDDATLTDQYLEWNWATDNRLDSIDSATGRQHALPHTGDAPKWQFFNHTEPLLHLPSSTAPGELDAVPESTSSPRIMRIRKRS